MSRSTLALISALLFTSLLSGCLQPQRSVGRADNGGTAQERGAAGAIRIERRLIVVFAPPELPDEIEKEVPGASEAMEHIEFAIADTEQCVGDEDVALKLVVASELTIEQDGGRDRIALPAEWPQSVGAYLFAPGRKPCVVHAVAGPSSLSTILPQAAGEYYGIRACLGEDSPSPLCDGKMR